MTFRERLRRALVCDSLAGNTNQVTELLRIGLESFQQTRVSLTAQLRCDLHGVRSLRTRCPIGRNRILQLNVSTINPPVEILYKEKDGGSVWWGSKLMKEAAERISELCKREAKLMAVSMAIETARVRCYELAEESTRWM